MVPSRRPRRRDASVLYNRFYSYTSTSCTFPDIRKLSSNYTCTFLEGLIKLYRQTFFVHKSPYLSPCRVHRTYPWYQRDKHPQEERVRADSVSALDQVVLGAAAAISGVVVDLVGQLVQEVSHGDVYVVRQRGGWMSCV